MVPVKPSAGSRADARAATIADRTGAGPTLSEGEPARFPGATAKFALLGEVLLTGLLVTGVSLAVVTLPIALAAGVRHLRRFIAAEDSRLGLFWLDVRRGLIPGVVVGGIATVVILLLLLDIDLAQSGYLPGGVGILAVGWLGLVVSVIFLLTLVGLWTPERGWLSAARGVFPAVRADPAGAIYLAATGAFVAVVTWTLAPLFVAAIGCAALAVAAVPVRGGRTR